jgi:hypothetical protein
LNKRRYAEAALEAWIELFQEERARLYSLPEESIRTLRQFVIEDESELWEGFQKTPVLAAHKERPLSYRIPFLFLRHPHDGVIRGILADEALFNSFAHYAFYFEYFARQHHAGSRQHRIPDEHQLLPRSYIPLLQRMYQEQEVSHELPDFPDSYARLIKSEFGTEEDQEMLIEYESDFRHFLHKIYRLSGNGTECVNPVSRSIVVRSLRPVDFFEYLRQKLVHDTFVTNLPDCQTPNRLIQEYGGNMHRILDGRKRLTEEALTYFSAEGMEENERAGKYYPCGNVACELRPFDELKGMLSPLPHDGARLLSWPRIYFAKEFGHPRLYFNPEQYHGRFKPTHMEFAFDEDALRELKENDPWKFFTDTRGLLPIGIKIHSKNNSLNEGMIPGSTRGGFGLKNSSTTLNFPPLGSSEVWEYIFMKSGFKIFDSEEYTIQVCLPQSLPKEDVALLAVSMLLGSDNVKNKWSAADLETSHATQTGARLVLYGAGGTYDSHFPYLVRKRTAGNPIGTPHVFPRLPLHGRTDVLGCKTVRDLEVVRLAGSLLTHARYQYFKDSEGKAYESYWHETGKRFVVELQEILMRHQIGWVLDVEWAYSQRYEDKGKGSMLTREEGDKRHFDALTQLAEIGLENVESAKRAGEHGEEPAGILYEVQDLLAKYGKLVTDEYAGLEREGKV